MLLRSQLGFVFFVVFTGPALAYIDPVTGSIIIQALIGGAAAALVALRAFRGRIASWFSSKKTDRSKAKGEREN